MNIANKLIKKLDLQKKMEIESLKVPKTDSFAEVRLILAFIVLVAHTNIIASAEQLYYFTRYFNSDFAIKGFFAISGYMVTKSYLSSDNYLQYSEKRFRRIYPAYVLVIIYCIFVGAITTNLKFFDFFFNLSFAKYLIANLSFLNFIQPTLPGSLSGNEFQFLNGSLWTIKVELMLYFTVPFLCLLYKKIGMRTTILLVFTLGIVWYIYFSQFFLQPLKTSWISKGELGCTISRQFPGQLPFFALGSVLGFLRLDKPKIIAIIFVSLVYYFLIRENFTVMCETHSAFREIANMIIYPFIVVLVARSNKLSIGLDRFGDLSYGIYLFHYPTIQLLEYFGLYKLNPYLGFLIGVLITLMLAAFSWHFVEKKFLKRSSHYLIAEIKKNKSIP